MDFYFFNNPNMFLYQIKSN